MQPVYQSIYCSAATSETARPHVCGDLAISCRRSHWHENVQKTSDAIIGGISLPRSALQCPGLSMCHPCVIPMHCCLSKPPPSSKSQCYTIRKTSYLLGSRESLGDRRRRLEMINRTEKRGLMHTPYLVVRRTPFSVALFQSETYQQR